MIKETSVEYLFGNLSTYLITTFWSRVNILIDAVNNKDATEKFKSIVPYGSALGPSIIKLKGK